MKEFIIGKNDAGQRADRFIQKAVPRLGNGRMYKFLREKKIKINGKRCEISTRLVEGDVMQMYINDEFFAAESDDKPDLSAVPSQISVVYEDENILLANKPSGLVVHEDDENTPDTLIARITKYLIEKGEYVPENEHSFAPALCNRLDRNTEGIVICAKNAESLRILNEAIKSRKLKKTYLCAVVGRPREDSSTIKTYLEKLERENTVYVRKEKTSRSKSAVTSYRVLKTTGELSLCEVDLITGRTHQIRVHMAYIGCPILGDGKYGRNEVNRRYHKKNQALCAYKLAFDSVDGALAYLNGRVFEVEKPSFVSEFFMGIPNKPIDGSDKMGYTKQG